MIEKTQRQSLKFLKRRRSCLQMHVKTQIELVKNNIAMKLDEMGTKLVDQLTVDEKDLLSQLYPELAELKEKLIETRKTELETNLSTNLDRRKQELEAVKQYQETDTLNAEAEAEKQELQDAKMFVEEVKKQLKSCNSNVCRDGHLL